LPAPEGDDMTNNKPRREILLNVLHLFAQLIDGGF
jgi:hypothetical protein